MGRLAKLAYNKVEIFKNGIIAVSYKDIWIDKHKFKRIIGSNSYYFTREGDIDLFTVLKPTRFIKVKKLSHKIDTRIRTLDIETRIVDNQHVPYLICYYDGSESYSFYLTDYNSPDDMIKACISSLLQPRNHDHKIYIHNLANFDGIFLLRNLVTFGELNVLLNQGKLISIDLTTEDKVKISFRDSYQILLSSLSKLGKSFDVENQKSIFPYKFVNDVDLNYHGIVPDIKYFDSKAVTESQYEEYLDDFFPGWSDKATTQVIDKFSKIDSFFKDYPDKLDIQLLTKWNLREEAIKYCINDCISLYEVMIKFNELFFAKFQININDHPTLPGLAFRLFRSKYLKDSKIPMIYGDNYKRLKLSYTGGAAAKLYVYSN